MVQLLGTWVHKMFISGGTIIGDLSTQDVYQGWYNYWGLEYTRCLSGVVQLLGTWVHKMLIRGGTIIGDLSTQDVSI